MTDKEIMWLVFIALGTIVSFAVTIGVPVLKLNGTLVRILYRLDSMETEIDEIETSKKESHIKIHNRIDKVEDDVVELDKRVTKLEK